jgi:hypothetical protein
MISKAMTPQHQRGNAEKAQIDRADLRVAEFAEPVMVRSGLPMRSNAPRGDAARRHPAGPRT